MTFGFSGCTKLHFIDANRSAHNSQAEFIIFEHIGLFAPHHFFGAAIIQPSKEQRVGQLIAMLQGNEGIVHAVV